MRLLPLLVLTALTPAPTYAAPPPDLAARVDAIFADVDSTRSPGAAVAVVKDGAVVLARGYGMADLEHGVPITLRTRFDVASVGKQLTAFAVLRLAEQGKLDLDDDYRKHLPEMPDFGSTITIRHLIHHTSGLRDYFALLNLMGVRPEEDSIRQDDVLRILARQKELNFEPGSEYLYSNSGYVLLATIVERVSGQSFHDWLYENIFDSLGMHATELGDDYRRLIPDRAESYARAGDSFVNARTNYAAYGPGLTYTHVEDLARWLANLGDPKVGDASTIETMLTAKPLNSGEPNSYAFGLVLGEHRGHRIADHSGSWAGYRTFLLWVPDEKLGIVVLSNLAGFDAAGSARAVADVALGEPTEDEVPPTPSESSSGSSRGTSGRRAARDPERPAPEAESLNAYAGRYVSPELETAYTLAVTDGQLEATHPRHGAIRLVPTDDEGHFQLRGDGLGGEVHFERNACQRVTGLRVTTDRSWNILFERAE